MKKLSLSAVLFSFLIFQSFGVLANTYNNQNDTPIQNGVATAQKEISDTAITAKVKAKLLADSRTSGMKITVSTASHVVTLTGKIKNEAEKKAAEEIAANTDSVKAVNNQLEVE